MSRRVLLDPTPINADSTFPLCDQTWRHVQQQLGLPPKQMQYVRLLLSGYGGHEIADRMGISYATLRTYVSRMHVKIGTRGQLDLVLRIMRIVDQYRGTPPAVPIRRSIRHADLRPTVDRPI